MKSLVYCIDKFFWNFYSNKTRIEKLRRRGVQIGSNCYINKDVDFGTEPYLIKIGDNCRLTSNVKLVTHDGSLWVLRNLNMLSNADKFGAVIIGNNVNIGNNATIMPGVKIGDNCIIGLGSIVTKDIPSNSIAVGVPARVISNIEDYYEKVKDKCELTNNLSSKEKRKYLKEKGYF